MGTVSLKRQWICEARGLGRGAVHRRQRDWDPGCGFAPTREWPEVGTGAVAPCGPAVLAPLGGHVCSPRPWPTREELGRGGRLDRGLWAVGESCVSAQGLRLGGCGADDRKLPRTDVRARRPAAWVTAGPRMAGPPVPAKAPRGAPSPSDSSRSARSP